MIKRKQTQALTSKKVVLFSKSFVFFLSFFVFFSCVENEEIQPIILSEVLESYSQSQLDEVIACAASKKGDDSTTFIYYYPIPEATNIQYYETTDVNVNPDDFSNYRQRTLVSKAAFGGYLRQFVREGNDEVYSIVTFETDEKFHKSNPIRLKQSSKPTEYNNLATINQSQSLMPLFSWSDGIFPNNAIYFQVISDENSNFISGTYTFDRWFQYYKLSNVVLDINREVPENLTFNNQYNFTMLAVSLDNWVNLVIEKPFVSQ